ncbi:unnamed protein product [Closterium sp. NIES-65]|nr:unnamed protein product [Closterium sp. NIES-65]
MNRLCSSRFSRRLKTRFPTFLAAVDRRKLKTKARRGTSRGRRFSESQHVQERQQDIESYGGCLARVSHAGDVSHGNGCIAWSCSCFHPHHLQVLQWWLFKELKDAQGQAEVAADADNSYLPTHPPVPVSFIPPQASRSRLFKELKEAQREARVAADADNPASRSRLFKELKEAQREAKGSADADIILSCDESNIYRWTALIKGPADTALLRRAFTLTINVPQQYPLVPPQVRFATKVFHPNVHFKVNGGDLFGHPQDRMELCLVPHTRVHSRDFIPCVCISVITLTPSSPLPPLPPLPRHAMQTGEICLDILKTAWSPAWTLTSVCRAIITLLCHPEADSPLNCDSGNLIRAGDNRGYCSMARMYTKLHAMPPAAR